MATLSLMAGRPKANQADVKSNMLRIRLTQSDRAKLDQAAAVESAETSTWARARLVAMADQILADEASAPPRRKKWLG